MFAQSLNQLVIIIVKRNFAYFANKATTNVADSTANFVFNLNNLRTKQHNTKRVYRANTDKQIKYHP